MKLVLRETCLKSVLGNQNKLIFKNRLKHLKRKCFGVLRQKKSRSHGVKDGCKDVKSFSWKILKPFRLSSEQGFKIFSNYKKLTTKPTHPGKCFINKSL